MPNRPTAHGEQLAAGCRHVKRNRAQRTKNRVLRSVATDTQEACNQKRALWQGTTTQQKRRRNTAVKQQSITRGGAQSFCGGRYNTGRIDCNCIVALVLMQITDGSRTEASSHAALSRPQNLTVCRRASHVGPRLFVNPCSLRKSQHGYRHMGCQRRTLGDTTDSLLVSFLCVLGKPRYY